jgi:hypothetical protein
VAATVGFVAGSIQSAIAYVPSDVFVLEGFAGLYALFVFTFSGFGWAPVAIFLFAAAHSIRRHASAPAWLAWIGYFAGFTATVASLSIFFDHSPLSPTSTAVSVLGGGPALVWGIGVGLVLIGLKEQAPS